MKSIDIPLVHVMFEKNKCYVYDTNKNALFNLYGQEINDLYMLLEHGIEKFKNICPNSKLLYLIEKGYLSSFSPSEIQHLDNNIVDNLLSTRLAHLILQVTQKCNFCCRYCGFAGDGIYQRQHSSINMDKSIAQKAIDYFYLHSTESEKISISLYGGEPLLNYDLVKWIIEYSKKIFWPRKIEFTMTTNASLLTEDIVKYFEINDMKLAISLDGPSNIQNKNRPFLHNGTGTFDVVYKNVLAIKQLHREYFDSMVSFNPVLLSENDIDYVKTFYEKELGVSLNSVNINKADISGVDYIDSKPVLNSDKSFIESEQFERFQTSIRDTSAFTDVWQHNGPCIPGVDRLYVSVDGKFYPCEKVPEVSCVEIGDVENGLNISKVKELSNIGKLTEKECKDCWAKRFCLICLANCVDYKNDCLSKQAKINICSETKKRADKFLREKINKEK